MNDTHESSFPTARNLLGQPIAEPLTGRQRSLVAIDWQEVAARTQGNTASEFTPERTGKDARIAEQYDPSLTPCLFTAAKVRQSLEGQK